MSTTLTLQQAIDQRPLSWLQVRVILLCWLVNVLDGFDLLAVAFAAPAIAQSWQLTPATLGVVFSSGLVGMTLGSLTLGPLSDRIGRRKMILFATFALGLATLLTSQANGLPTLLVLRFVTGLAIGGLLPSLNTLVAEYAPDRRRNFAVSIMHLGFPVGGIIGGALAAQLIPEFGWQSVFIAGGLLTLLMMPLLIVGLPESLLFLRLSKRPGAAQTANSICAQLGITADQLQHNEPPPDQRGAAPLLRAPWLLPSVTLWSCFFFGYLTLYFLINWIPTILTAAGQSSDSAIGAGIALNLGGGVGMLVLGWLSARRPIKPMISIFFVVAALLMVALGRFELPPAQLLTLTAITGFFGLGGLIGLYSVAARLYTDATRASGVGLAIGAGRFGAILGPLLGGLLIGLDWQMGDYFLLLAAPLVLAGLMIRRVQPPTLK
ncbi:MAG: MFS transporter [Gammaproteobacteria bacterium]|nr:MAG: MFS transporter [Gammaproteobacteria bacterium]RLA15820.1 MAG: MFS transporter [Gammaproteobacteria bacterium]